MYYKFNVIGNKGTTKRAILSSYKLLRIARTLRHDIILLDAITAYRGKYCDVHRQLFSQDLCEIHKNYFPRYTPFGSSFSVPKGRYSLTRAFLHSSGVVVNSRSLVVDLIFSHLSDRRDLTVIVNYESLITYDADAAIV